MHASVRRKRRAAEGARDAVCFLCLEPIPVAERGRAFVRVVEDRAPRVPEFAHEECAEQAGLRGEPEEDEEEQGRIW